MGCRYCTILGKELDTKKGNIFYDLKIARKPEKLTLFTKDYEVIIHKDKRLLEWQEYKQYGLQADYIKKMCDSYGYGFVSGTNRAFKKQQEWGLVLVTPKEVQEASAHWSKHEFNARAALSENLHMSAYNSGYADGKRFDPKHRLNAGT